MLELHDPTNQTQECLMCCSKGYPSHRMTASDFCSEFAEACNARCTTTRHHGERQRSVPCYRDYTSISASM